MDFKGREKFLTEFKNFIFGMFRNIVYEFLESFHVRGKFRKTVLENCMMKYLRPLFRKTVCELSEGYW